MQRGYYLTGSPETRFGPFVTIDDARQAAEDAGHGEPPAFDGVIFFRWDDLAKLEAQVP